jgi:hypothetical protein
MFLSSVCLMSGVAFNMVTQYGETGLELPISTSSQTTEDVSDPEIKTD